MATETINPVVSQKPDEKLEKVTVTIADGEIAAILTSATEKVIKTAFELQDDYDNPSQYQRDALHDAAVMFLKAQCLRYIGQWDALVTKMSKVTKYRNVGRQKLEDTLKVHPKCKDFWNRAQKATLIKANL